MLTCISRITGLSIFVVALAVLLSAQSAASAEDRFGDGRGKNGAQNASRRDDGTSRDKGGASGDTGRGGGGDSRGDDGAGDPGGRNSGKDNRGGTDGDSRGRGGH